MIIFNRTLTACILVLIVFCQSCYRNEIEFGNIPDNNYTNLVYIDSVQPKLSTVVLDSFATGSATSFLLGRYKDPYLGIVSAKPFFQMTIPSSTVSIASASQFDSACFIIHLNKYYYGDTSRTQTIYVNELAEIIDYTYNNNLYNTSNFYVKPGTLGNKTLRIRPSSDDSIIIKLNDAKGLELYNKLQQQSDEVANDDNFQNYFKGISLSVNDNDTTAIYGLDGSAGDFILRVYYHTTIPYKEERWIDFSSKANGYSFNQVVTDRTRTSLYSAAAGVKEFLSDQTSNVAFTQHGTGVFLKMIFPSVKGIVTTDKIVKLQRAELIIRPVRQTYDNFTFKLPSALYLAQTNGTNSIGSVVLDSTSATQIISPVVDEIYGVNTYYRFNVTPYINSLLTNSGTEDAGFFLLENKNLLEVDRAVIGNSRQSLFKTQLLLTVITINK